MAALHLSSRFSFPTSLPPPLTTPPTPRLPIIRCFLSQPSASTHTATLTSIQNSGVIACLRAQSAQMAMEAAHAAISGGISVLEVVMSTPGFTSTGARLSYHNSRRVNFVEEKDTCEHVQVGTVLNTDDANKAINSGAKFIMSPAMVKGILDQYSGALYIPGVMTPTEILSAYNAGAKMVKVYPVSAVGGVRYIATLRKPFSHIPIVASQGITIGQYIAQGASSVVLSDAIFDKEAMAQRNFGAVYRLAQLAAFQGKEAVERKRRFNPL